MYLRNKGCPKALKDTKVSQFLKLERLTTSATHVDVIEYGHVRCRMKVMICDQDLKYNRLDLGEDHLAQVLKVKV